MSEEHIICESICHLVRKYLLVDRPGQWLTHLIFQVGHPRHRRILRIVCVDDAHEVIFGECPEVVEQIFDHLMVLLLVGRLCGEQT